MSFVPTRTDESKYAAVDGKAVAFGTTVEASAAGFGVKTTVKGKEVFEVLDALPLNRASVQVAVEAGSAALVDSDNGPGPANAGFVAIDFGTQDRLTSVETTASDSDGLQDSYALDSDLT